MPWLLRYSNSKNNYKIIVLLTYHVKFSLISVWNIIPMIPSDSWKSQLSFDVSLYQICHVVMEILTEM